MVKMHCCCCNAASRPSDQAHPDLRSHRVSGTTAKLQEMLSQYSPALSAFCSHAMEEAALPQLRRSHMAGGSHARGNSAKRKSDGRPGRSEHDKRQRLLFQTYDAVRLHLQRLQHRIAGDVPQAAEPSTRAVADWSAATQNKHQSLLLQTDEPGGIHARITGLEAWQRG